MHAETIFFISLILLFSLSCLFVREAVQYFRGER